jgi:hypothetical protein
MSMQNRSLDRRCRLGLGIGMGSTWATSGGATSGSVGATFISSDSTFGVICWTISAGVGYVTCKGWILLSFLKVRFYSVCFRVK